MVDLDALHRELHRALTASLPAIERGLTLSRNLAALDPDDAATLATWLSHDLTDRQLLALGRGGLHALRRAASTGAPERSDHAVGRITAALRRLPPLRAERTEDGMWVLGADPLPPKVTRALPELSAAPDSAVVILVSAGDRKTGKARLCEHYRQCFDELPDACRRAIERGQVWLLPIERLSARRSLWARVRSFVVRVPAWA